LGACRGLWRRGDPSILKKLDHAPAVALHSALLRTCRPPRRSAPAANAFNPAIKNASSGLTGVTLKVRSRLDKPGWIDIKSRMSSTPKQTFDVYRKRTNPTLRLAVAPGAGLPGQFASKDWTLVEEPSVLHSEVSEDVITKGYCTSSWSRANGRMKKAKRKTKSPRDASAVDQYIGDGCAKAGAQST
jgi:hypothetical protein